MRAACSVSTQKTMVFWKRSPLSLRKSVTLLATSLVRSSMTSVAVEVFLIVDAVVELVAIAVGFSLLGAVALDVHVDVDLDHLVGSEEAVADALLERIGVNGIAEVMDVGDVFGLLRRSGEADLGGGGEVFKDLPPGGILGRAAAVALVDDDQVEEIRGELPVELLPFLGAGDGLVEGEVNLVGGVDAALLVRSRW